LRNYCSPIRPLRHTGEPDPAGNDEHADGSRPEVIAAYGGNAAGGTSSVRWGAWAIPGMLHTALFLASRPSDVSLDRIPLKKDC
jgi:hypothetical protein